MPSSALTQQFAYKSDLYFQLIQLIWAIQNKIKIIQRQDYAGKFNARSRPWKEGIKSKYKECQFAKWMPISIVLGSYREYYLPYFPPDS